MKGKYYRIVLNIMNARNINGTIIGGVGYLYKQHIKGIYDTIPLYFKEDHVIDNEEFIFSMRWALADIFGGGCEVDEPEGLFDFLDKKEVV